MRKSLAISVTGADRARWLPVAVLLVLVLFSTFAVVATRHQNRIAFYDLQKLYDQRDQQQIHWGRLMLERTTWAVEHNIVKDAGQRLGMAEPDPERIVVIQPGSSH